MHKGTSLAALLCALAFATPALAQETLAPQPQITEPSWITNPRYINLGDYFPPVPLALGQSGRAVLTCAVALDNSAECAVAEETPSGMGFGAAALRMSEQWRFTPRLVDGQPVAGGQIRVPLNFALGAEAQPAPVGDGFTVTARRRGRGNAQFYPEAARANGVEGAALIGCVMRIADTLDCGVEQEEPNGAGFGAAAIRAIVDSYAMRERGGFEHGAVVRIPVNFRLNN